MSGGAKYDAFLSYARVDNETADAKATGEVVKFHKALELELRKIWKRECRIFIDPDIKPGADWRTIIENSLHAVNFMVCMLSPSFFGSKECRKEVEIFREKARKAGLEPKFFPVILHPLTRVEQDGFYREITRFQTVDLRSLRRKAADSEEFGEFVSKLAHAILESVEEEQPAKKSLEELLQELEDLQNERQALNSLVEELTSKLAAKSGADQTTNRQEIARLKGDLAKVTGERDQFAAKVAALQKEVKDLEAQLAAVKQELVAARAAYAELEARTAREPVPSGYNPIALASGVEMIVVPGGPFIMGADDPSNAKPKRTVTLSPYRLSKTPITVAQFRAYTVADNEKFDWNGRKPDWGWIDDHPMVRVTWDEARAYCKWAGGDLPTEAQWERAARETDGRTYPWGNDWDPGLCVHSDKKPGDMKSTAPVNRRNHIYSTSLGHTEMAGNVWQWCLDWYSTNGYEGLPDIDPEGVHNGTSRVLRGGSWRSSSPDGFRSSFRSDSDPSSVFNIVGFRLSGL